MTLDELFGLVALVGVIVCGVPLYIDSRGGWTMYRAERRRRKRWAAWVRYSRRGRFIKEAR